LKTDFGDLRHRFDAFAARFWEKAAPDRPASPSRPPADPDDYWESVQELFTRDVTERGLRELALTDAQDTFRYFTREVDLSGLGQKPWYKRYPLSVWRVYLHTAFRLSPARRLLFAVAVPLLSLGWLRYLLSFLPGGVWDVSSSFPLLLLAATLLFLLLVLELRDKLTLKGDLEIARQIQFGLLPLDSIQRETVAVCAIMRPANTVGGDYFDVIDLEEGGLALAMADVAGKGIPAALLMALLQGSLRTLLTAGLRGEELVGKLNRHLCANIPSNRLITLFYGEYDAATATLRYVNAGHNAPFLLRRDGAQERLPATGVALGVLPEASFAAESAVLAPGERLFLFTDGVSEAFDARECEYGEERLAAFLFAHHHLADRELIEGVREDVLAFCGAARPKDDMTLMVVAHPG